MNMNAQSRNSSSNILNNLMHMSKEMIFNQNASEMVSLFSRLNEHMQGIFRDNDVDNLRNYLNFVNKIALMPDISKESFLEIIIGDIIRCLDIIEVQDLTEGVIYNLAKDILLHPILKISLSEAIFQTANRNSSRLAKSIYNNIFKIMVDKNNGTLELESNKYSEKSTPISIISLPNLFKSSDTKSTSEKSSSNQNLFNLKFLAPSVIDNWINYQSFPEVTIIIIIILIYSFTLYIYIYI